MGQGRELGQDSGLPRLFLGGMQGPWSPGAEHGHCQQKVLVKAAGDRSGWPPPPSPLWEMELRVGIGPFV